MPLFTTKQLTEKTLNSTSNFSIPAFNVHNMEYTKAVIAAAEKENSPVILMLGEPIFHFADLDTIANIALFAAKNAKVPVAILLDHGKIPANIERCIELGISIMIDGSYLPFDENIAFTKKYVDMAHAKGLSAEGELGALSGSEDGEEEREQKMTNPEMAKIFVEATGIDMLAVSIGNAHGEYKFPPVLDYDRLKKIQEVVDVPIVMHGGSDLPADSVEYLVQNGIAKFNIGTDLKIAFSTTLRDILLKNPIPYQPFDSLLYAMNAVEEVTRSKIKTFHSNGKASLFE